MLRAPIRAASSVPPVDDRPIVIAHRTCPRDAPENSLTGIEVARRLGADVVEVDVRRTADGVPVLLHDRWLTRTAGRTARLDSTPYERTRHLRTRGGGSIPSLAEALEAAGESLVVALDVKDPGAGDAVVSEIDNQQARHRVLFWSKHESNLRVAAARAPDIEAALLRDTRGSTATARLVADAAELRARAISASWSEVSPALRAACDARGIRLYAWCKSRQIDLGRLAVLHGVVTDWPATARQAITELA